MWEWTWGKTNRALGQNETHLGVKWNDAILPCSILPRVAFCPNIPCFILPPRLHLEKTYHINNNIVRCSMKWCENANKRCIIIFSHMQQSRILICQSNCCQNSSKLIYQKGEISFCEILKTWSIASLILMCDDELADDRNQVDVKIDPRQPCFFFKTHSVPFCPHVPFCLDILYFDKLRIISLSAYIYIYSNQILPLLLRWLDIYHYSGTTVNNGCFRVVAILFSM